MTLLYFFQKKKKKKRGQKQMGGCSCKAKTICHMAVSGGKHFGATFGKDSARQRHVPKSAHHRQVTG